ncbi:MAG TPA: galactokinase [Candidatus Binatia bacterium]|nr:galactokinase [Candidatus Binatia bacterium]
MGSSAAPAPWTPGELRVALEAAFPGAGAEAVVVRAPGRVNLIGEHTDYNEGFVLPVAIDREIRIAAARQDDRRVEVVFLTTGERGAFSLDDLGPARTGSIAYVAGVAWALQEAGATLAGLRAVVASNLPIGAGLSSSAALELAAAWALLGPAGPAALGLDPMGLARLCQRAENEFVGVRCGLMDQFAAALGDPQGALLLDCRSLAWRVVPLPLASHALVVCHTGSARRLDASAYNERRAACERAVAVLAAHDPAVRSLRDLGPDRLADLAPLLDPITLARVRHVVTENERVGATVRALEAGDLGAVGAAFAASHASLRDDYGVSSPELDAMVEIATSVEGVVGARMTGAGFGGCTVNLVRRDAVDRLRAAVEAEYPRRTGLTPAVYPVEPAAGAGIIAGDG